MTNSPKGLRSGAVWDVSHDGPQRGIVTLVDHIPHRLSIPSSNREMALWAVCISMPVLAACLAQYLASMSLLSEVTYI